MQILTVRAIFCALAVLLIFSAHGSIPTAEKTPVTAYFEPYECLGLTTWPSCIETKKRNPALKQKGEK
jgi:preprotein translocase subunit Sec63